MKKFVIVFTVIICFFNSSIFIQAQNDDQVSGSEPIVVPENINPREDHTFSDTDDAVNQPKLQGWFMVGFNYGF